MVDEAGDTDNSEAASDGSDDAQDSDSDHADSSKVTEQPEYFTGYSWEAMEMLFNLYQSLRTPTFYSRLSVIDEEPWRERTSEIYVPCSARVSLAPNRRFEVPEIPPFRAASQPPEMPVWQQYRQLREIAKSWWDAREPHLSNLTTIAEEDEEPSSEHCSGTLVASASEVDEVPESFGIAEIPVWKQYRMLTRLKRATKHWWSVRQQYLSTLSTIYEDEEPGSEHTSRPHMSFASEVGEAPRCYEVAEIPVWKQYHMLTRLKQVTKSWWSIREEHWSEYELATIEEEDDEEEPCSE